MTTKELYQMTDRLCEAILFNWEPDAAAALARESLAKIKRYLPDEILTTKEDAIRAVIRQRCKVLDRIIEKREGELKQYYIGKQDGLIQAFELLGETLASIRIELE